MKNSLAFGVPAGAIAFFLYALLYHLGLLWLFIALSVLSGICMTYSLWRIGTWNRAYFPFHYAWMSAFTISFVAALTTAGGAFLYWLDFAGEEMWQILGVVPEQKDKTDLSFMLAFEIFSLTFAIFVVVGTVVSLFVKQKSVSKSK